MSDPPITSKATTAGEVAVPIVAVCASHPAPSELPAAMMQLIPVHDGPCTRGLLQFALLLSNVERRGRKPRMSSAVVF